ncbi:Arm DNA-binding domain-containing protein [Pseudocolwellia sp. HL-MZ19]|uniref:Arm DNA-binding domain-containing protein n=1 Tax=unclassified Pseudocolwellia TaxID=2848178 RepID=UPI003CEBB404
MGHIRVRKETGKLYLDFKYKNLRCREQTTLNDTQTNHKKLGSLLTQIEALILVNQFDYAKQFPGSKMLPKLKKSQKTIVQVANGTPDFEMFANTWFDEMQSSWRISYTEKVRNILDNRILPRFENEDVGQITKADLMQFRAQLAKVTRKNGNSLSAGHINKHMKILRMILNEAADRYDFTTPYRNIKPLKVPKTDIAPFTLEEVSLILSTVRSDFTNYYLIRFFTGLRTGEINGLKWQYIDFDRQLILVRECLLDGRTEYTKNDGSYREIQMSQPVFDALKKQFIVTGDNGYVFTNKNSQPLDNNNVAKRVWHPLLRLLELKTRSPYQTRHTAATLWLASGEAPEWIAKQMGHSSTMMLFRVYSRYVPNLTRQDGSAFESLLSEKFLGVDHD